jgi:hypothetical protein
LDTGSARRKAATYAQNNTKQNKRTQAFMSRVGFEPTIPVFEWAKAVHALDRTAAVIGMMIIIIIIIIMKLVHNHHHDHHY